MKEQVLWNGDEPVEEVCVVITVLNPNRFFQALENLENQARVNERLLLLINYCMPNVSEKKAGIILASTVYLNKEVWKRNI
jgi:UDP-N-acetyl-L-fucosamine synthase